jgi:hypothetical protein
MTRKCHAVKTRDMVFIHVMQDEWFGTGSTPIGLLAPRKKTLCGQVATRNVGDVFLPGEATCEECRRRYESLS